MNLPGAAVPSRVAHVVARARDRAQEWTFHDWAERVLVPGLGVYSILTMLRELVFADLGWWGQIWRATVLALVAVAVLGMSFRDIRAWRARRRQSATDEAAVAAPEDEKLGHPPSAPSQGA